jgi:hypothetical protein
VELLGFVGPTRSPPKGYLLKRRAGRGIPARFERRAAHKLAGKASGVEANEAALGGQRERERVEVVGERPWPEGQGSSCDLDAHDVATALLLPLTH